MNKKLKNFKDFDPIESKRKNKKKVEDNKFDPSRKNKKHFIKNYHEYV